jgi:regulator of RNase E activity RraB
MDLLYLFLLAGAAIAIWRIVTQVRRGTNHSQDDWDQRMIENLRRSGINPFQPMEVDFFVAMPSLDAANTLAQTLRGEGYAVDIREMPDSTDQTHSVHALKTMQLHIEAVRAVSRRLTELADAAGGRYDGWAPGAEKTV